MHEVQGVQPRPFNCACCRSVAAKAGSVHLMYSNDRKLGQKGGARTHPKQPYCSWRMPILNKNLTDHRKSTNLATNTAEPQWHDPLPGWNPSQADWLYFSQTLPTIAPESSSSLTNRLGFGWARIGGAWQRSKVTIDRARPPYHSPHWQGLWANHCFRKPHQSRAQIEDIIDTPTDYTQSTGHAHETN